MLILVTGGSRSGKSSFALRLAESGPLPRIFLATAQALDAEMEERIERHRRSRSADWELVEEPLGVPDALTRALSRGGTVLVDCITLWVSNLILADQGFSEQEAAGQAEDLARRARAAGGLAIFVTNEVGSGVVPDSRLGRIFRDCAGRMNQVLARAADEVHLLVSGIPVRIKTREGGPSGS
jgi:adenosylcobinamide kinase/adenosylcobinamide-phosphate guanylyltransferase